MKIEEIKIKVVIIINEVLKEDGKMIFEKNSDTFNKSLFDSLSFMKLIINLEEVFDIYIDEDYLIDDKIYSIAYLSQIIQKELKNNE